MAFSPFHAGQDPVHRRCCPRAAQIDADLQLLAGKVTAVRTYSSLKSLGAGPEHRRAPSAQGRGRCLARSAAGDQRAGDRRGDRARATAHPNVIRLVIGNEVDPARRSHASPSWRGSSIACAPRSSNRSAPPSRGTCGSSHPELVEHVDFIAVHLLPYWEGIPVEQAIDYLAIAHANCCSARFPASRSSSPKSAGRRTAARARRRSPRPATKRCSCGASCNARATKATSTT